MQTALAVETDTHKKSALSVFVSYPKQISIAS